MQNQNLSIQFCSVNQFELIPAGELIQISSNQSSDLCYLVVINCRDFCLW